jgi:FkbM family methyltransferase
MKVDAVIKTWWNDLSFCSYCLRFLERNWTQENSNIIVLANADCQKVTDTWGFSARVRYFFLEPWPDGNQFQGYITLLADHFSDADLFAVFDSDTMLLEPMNLAMLTEQGKPILYYRPYQDGAPEHDAVPRRMWGPIMQHWLGVAPQADYMQRFPFVYRASTLRAVRRLVTGKTKKGLLESLYSPMPYNGPEDFAGHSFTWCEHNVISFYAALREPELYCFKDLTGPGLPPSWPVKQYWSWGWNESVMHELDAILASNYQPINVPKRTTASGWMVLAEDVRHGHSSLTAQADDIEVDVGGLPTHRFIAPYLKPGTVVLDVGAHIGNFTVPIMRAIGPAGLVLALEPHPGILPCLLHNVDKERRQNPAAAGCTILNYAAGAEDGILKLHCNPTNYASNTLLTNVFDCSVPAVDVKVVPLDAISDGGREISFVKIDVEGGEFQVLKGAQRLLKQHHPAIFMEFSENFLPLAGVTEEELFAFLRELGYSNFVPFPEDWIRAGHHAHDLLVTV